MKFRTAALLAAPFAACLAVSANAAAPAKAPKPLTVTDAVGDANAVNDGGLVTGSPVPSGTSTGPAAVSAFDIKSLTFAATGAMATKKVGRTTVRYFNCTGYTVTLEMAGAPVTTGTLYRVQASTQSLEVFWLQFNNPAGGKTTTTLRYTDESAPPESLGTSSVQLKNPAKVVGNKVVFTVTGSDIAKAGERFGRTAISGLGADVRNSTPLVTVPMWDQLVTDGSQVWKVCPQ